MTYKNTLIVSFILVGLFGVFAWSQPISYQLEPEYVTTRQIEPSTTTVELYSLNNKTTFTGYSLSVDETDGSPCIGAWSNNLCDLKPLLAKDNIRICASRDLRKDTLVYIDGFGECIIKDRMNIRYKDTGIIDILFDSKQEAINFGNKQLKYVIL